MVRKVYIGRPSTLHGRTAFQLLANLKNFGIGRMLTRSEFDQYPEPSYHIVRRVENIPMEVDMNWGKLYCETVIRGKRFPGVRPLFYAFRPDFRLIPKDEEEDFLRGYQVEELDAKPNILPRTLPLPPLMREFIKREQARGAIQQLVKGVQSSSGGGEWRIPAVYLNEHDLKRDDSELFQLANRIAKDETEQPTIKLDGKFHFSKEWLKGTSAEVKKDGQEEEHRFTNADFGHFDRFKLTQDGGHIHYKQSRAKVNA